MAKIESRIDPSSEKYQSNFDHHKGLANDLNGVLAEIRKMGPPKRIEKHKARGKQTARERIENLKDPNIQFVEFSELAAYQVYDDILPAAGIVTGLISIHGRQCIVVANDATVKGEFRQPCLRKQRTSVVVQPTLKM